MQTGRFTQAALVAIGLLTAIAGPGCLAPDEKPIDYDGPVLLAAPGLALRGDKLETILVEAEQTVFDAPLGSQTMRRVAAKVKLSIVSLYVRTATPYRMRLLPSWIPGPGLLVSLPGAGLGSGFFVHSSGYVLTNNHVIHNATEIMALLPDGKQLQMSIVARDPAHDLALLKADDDSLTLTPLPMGDSDAVAVGDIVVAVGNPLGLGYTVTAGIISHTGRDLAGISPREVSRVPFIQTDAAINPGSSGGPLTTLTGAWIGVNSAMIREAQGIGFAVPSKQALEFVKSILAGKGVPDKQP